MFSTGSSVILHHTLLLKNVKRGARLHPLMDHSNLPFLKSVITSLLCLKVKYVNISGSITSSFTCSNFSHTAEHDLPSCLLYVLLNTICPRHTTVSFGDLSINSIFKHVQDLSPANCFTVVCLYSKFRKQSNPTALSKFGCDTEKCSMLLGRN